MSEQPPWGENVVRVVTEERWAMVVHATPPSGRARVAAWWNDHTRWIQVGRADGRRAIGAFSSSGRVVKLWRVRDDGTRPDR